MALTSYATGNALTQKLWSKALAQEARGQCYFSRFMGTGQDSLIQIKEETGKDKGDQVTFGLRMLLTGDGITGDSTLEGNEESLTTHSDAVLLGQLRTAVRSAGELSEQRVPFSVREEAMKGQADWWAERLDTVLLSHLAGYLPNNPTSVTGGSRTTTEYNGHNTIVAAATGRLIRVNSEATDEALASNDPFDLTYVDQCVMYASIQDSNGNPRIRPLRIDGKPKYVMFLHPGQVNSMRTSTSTGQWLDITKAVYQGSKESNPIYSGALGEYNGVVLHQSSYVPQGYHSTSYAAQANTRRAVFCGAQAAVVAFGRKYSFENIDYIEKRFDYDNQLGVASRAIFGIKKCVFNSKDFGCIVVSSYSAV